MNQNKTDEITYPLALQNNCKSLVSFLGLIVISIFFNALYGQFVHPGILHKTSDLDRMRYMVEAGIEPWKSSFDVLEADAKSSYSYEIRKNPNDHTLSRENPAHQRNEYESDALAAYQNALMWYITQDTRHAEKTIAILNAWSALVNFYGGGTEPLCAGLYGAPLINAAEIIKGTYSGWSSNDIQKFKDMLVYPGYSATTVTTAAINNDEVTFYWRTYMGDPGIHGNQGLLAWRTVMAIGIFLDNKIIYDRALNYILGRPHRSDDLPYQTGSPNTTPQDTGNQYYNEWKLNGHATTIPDYGYDDQIQYYIYDNGQCQESSRDQVHASLGIATINEMAEVVWNQGTDIYNFLDDRLLKGLDFTIKYNLSNIASYPDQTVPWEPDPDSYYQLLTRTGRWQSLKINPWVGNNLERNSRGEEVILRPMFEMPYAHYTVRENKADQAKWVVRAQTYAVEKTGYEQGDGMSSPGWGGLTYHRPEGCAGDPIRGFSNNTPDFNIPVVPTTIEAENYDFFSGNADGRTYHDTTSGNKGMEYRNDNVDIGICSEGGYAVENIASGEYLHYTLYVPNTGTYDLSIRYAAENSNAEIQFEFAGTDKTGIVPMPSTGGLQIWNDHIVKTGIPLSKGVQNMKILFDGADNAMAINTISIIENGTAETCNDYDAFSRIEAEDYCDKLGINHQGSDIGNIANGDWIQFDTIDFGSGSNTIEARVSSNTTGGTIDIRLGSATGTRIGNLTVSNTGGWDSWRTISSEILITSGVQKVYFVFSGNSNGLFDIDWIKFGNNTVLTTEGLNGITAHVKSFPNPVADHLYLQKGEALTTELDAQLINLKGQVLFAKNNMNTEHSFDLSRLPPGLYLLQLTDQEHTEIRKIMKN